MEINKIYNEDCLEGMKRVADGTVDMILCDLPYGTTQNKWDSVIPLDALWEQYRRVIKPNGAIVLTAQTPFDKVLGASNISLLRYEWIWRKTKATGHLNSKKMPMKEHENILVFYKNLPVYNPQGLIKLETPVRRKRKTNGPNYGKSNKVSYRKVTGYPKDILEIPSESKPVHPTQKPVALFEYLIKTYTNLGELVLDNCMGSGTTAISCMNTNRNFIGFEMDKGYYDIACNRIEQHKKAGEVNE